MCYGNRIGDRGAARRPASPTPAVPALILAALVLVLGACNTISGVGKDIGAAGETLSETAEKTKEKL